MDALTKEVDEFVFAIQLFESAKRTLGSRQAATMVKEHPYEEQLVDARAKEVYEKGKKLFGERKLV